MNTDTARFVGHTAEPWELRPSSKKGNGREWRDIVSTGEEFSPSYVGEALERDAVLMVAAPQLLRERDMLREALATLVNLRDGVADGGSGILQSDWNAARAALAATGGGK